MIRIAALTSGKNTPSSRFRVRQHLGALLSYQIQVDEFIPVIDKWRRIPLLPEGIKPRHVPPMYLAWTGVKAATRLPGLIGSWTHHITWLQRELIPALYTVERFLKKPIVFDVDDAIWTVSPLGEATNRSLAQRSDIILAGNSYLAAWYRQYAQDVRIIPTAVNADQYVPIQQTHSANFIIGWTGTSSNLPYIEAIEPVLKQFVSNYPSALVRVICDKKPNFRLLDSYEVEYIPWSPAVEVSSVQSMSIGLMPLKDTPMTRGKCSFKMLQYMSCGLPVIVSPIGMNQDILKMDSVGWAAQTHNDWYEALEHYYKNRDEMSGDGSRGRQIVLDHFSQEVVVSKIAAIFKELA